LHNENLWRKRIAGVQVDIHFLYRLVDNLGIVLEHREGFVPICQLVDNVLSAIFIHPDINAIDHAGKTILFQVTHGINKSPVSIKDVRDIIKCPCYPHFNNTDLKSSFLLSQAFLELLGEMLLKSRKA